MKSMHKWLVNPAAPALLLLAGMMLFSIPTTALAQTAGIWRVSVWLQDDGGPYDQFAPFCETGAPCTVVTGIEVCVDGAAECGNTAGAEGAYQFAPLSAGLHEVCITNPNYVVVSGSSAGATSANPNCVERTVADNENVTSAIYIELATVEVVVNKVYTETHPTAGAPEVEFTLVCDAGTVSTEDPNAEPEQPTGDDEDPVPVVASASKMTTGGSASFWVTGAANCYVTELEPAGYIQTTSDCGSPAAPAIILPSEEPVSCTITNRPTEVDFTVDKNFSDGNPELAAVVTPLCTDVESGPGITYSPASGNALHGTNFVTTVKYFVGAVSCTASEVDLPGYTEDLAISTCDTGTSLGDSFDGGCIIHNDQDPISIEASKVYSDGGGGSVDFAVECTNLDTGGSVTPATAAAAPGSPAVFTVNDVMWDGSTLCSVSEPVPPGGYFESDNTCTSDNLDMTPDSDDPRTCEITNSSARATFRVTKYFADGNNVDEITVSIDCNTGLILDQDKELGDGEWVEFIVTDFTDGNLACTITEDGEAGYSGEYDNVTLGNIISDESCDYPAETIEGDSAHECVITNTPDPVDIVVHKEWIIEGTANAFETEYKINLYCQASGMTGSGVQEKGYHSWRGSDAGDGDDTFTWQIIPLFPSSTCHAEERYLEDYVEVENGCGNLVASAGNGAECTITNTVFFEGIPTLSQYGMAILALLMLGVGMVTFRRFS